MQTRIDELVALLDKRSLRARQLYREIAGTLADSADDELLMRLEMEIGRLDFDAARQTLMQVCGDLGLGNDE